METQKNSSGHVDRGKVGVVLGRTCRLWSVLLLIVGIQTGCVTLRMPGTNYAGPRVPLTPAEHHGSQVLQRDVASLAGDLGRRNAIDRVEQLQAAADYIAQAFQAAGYTPQRQVVPLRLTVTMPDGTPHHLVHDLTNVEVELPGQARASEIVVVGAHYDSVYPSPGADDNASGVAALLALARTFVGHQPARTLRFVAFVNEEPPFFHTSATMGSTQYAQRCATRQERIVAMMSLESLGYYVDTPHSQHYPFPGSLFYPSTGNFVMFVGNHQSVGSIQAAAQAFRRVATVPSYGLAAFLKEMGWSDHRSFWEAGYPGFMVTDTAPFRNPHYHTADDTPATLDYQRLTQVVTGLEEVIRVLAGIERPAVEF